MFATFASICKERWCYIVCIASKPHGVMPTINLITQCAWINVSFRVNVRVDFILQICLCARPWLRCLRAPVSAKCRISRCSQVVLIPIWGTKCAADWEYPWDKSA